MAESFSVGEIAEYRACLHSVNAAYVGQECEVIGGLQWRRPKHIVTGAVIDVYGYKTRARDGQIFTTEPDQLRKRRPPQDWKTLCSLDDTPVEVPQRELETA